MLSSLHEFCSTFEPFGSYIQESANASGAGTPKRKSSSELTSSLESDTKKVCAKSSEYVVIEPTEGLATDLFSKGTNVIVWGMQHRAVQVSVVSVLYDYSLFGATIELQKYASAQKAYTVATPANSGFVSCWTTTPLPRCRNGN